MHNSSTEDAALCHHRIQMKRIVIAADVRESFHILIKVKIILRTTSVSSRNLIVHQQVNCAKICIVDVTCKLCD